MRPVAQLRNRNLIIIAATLTGAVALVLVFEIGIFAGGQGNDSPAPEGPRDGAAAAAAPEERPAPTIPFHGLLQSVEDGRPIEEEGEAYLQLMGWVLGRESGLRGGKPVEPAELRSRPERFRGEVVKLTGLYVHSDPIRLSRSIRGTEWVHRAYLVDPRAEQGCVVDLVRRPELEYRAPASVEALFVRLAGYEGKNGPVTAPLLLGRELSPVEEKRTGSGWLNQGAITLGLATVCAGLVVALATTGARKWRAALGKGGP